MSVRGYADWKPKPEAALWVRRAAAVMEEEREEWPLSVRQLFYMLVAAYDYEKSEPAYGRLTQMLSRARRAGLIEWEPIRDGGQGDYKDPVFYSDADGFSDAVHDAAERFKLDRQRGQAQVVELWCEAGGMLPILRRIADPYSCRANTGSGYDSVTGKHQLACRVLERALDGLRTVVLHVGDFDPSGEDMCNVLREDAAEMVAHQVLVAAMRGDFHEGHVPESIEAVLEKAREGGAQALGAREQSRLWRWSERWLEVERVALTAEQVVERGVITAPPKPTDARMRGFLENNQWVVEELGTSQITAQLEALRPRELRELVGEQIEARLDMDVYRAVMEEEAGVRTDVLERLDRD